MSDITKSTGFVSLDKDGHLSIDGVKLNIRELLNTIDQKPSTYIQVDMPTKYNILDWWYNPDDGVLCMAVFLDNKIAWKETTFGTNSLLKSVTTGTEITATMLNNIMNDFYAKVNEIGIKLVNGEVIKNDGSLTNGELAFRKTKVINYIYNGDLSLPPLIQNGGRIWNIAKNGFCKSDTLTGFGFNSINNTLNWDVDTIYDSVNKTFTINTLTKGLAGDTWFSIGRVLGETAIELIGQDLVFSMDVNVTKATQCGLNFYVNSGDGVVVYYQTPIVFSLTPGRQTMTKVFTLTDSAAIKAMTLGRQKVNISVSLFLENNSIGSYDNMPAITAVNANTLTFYGFKLNKGVIPLLNQKDDFRNMSYYSNMFPKASISTLLDNYIPGTKGDFSAGWSIPAWCTVTTYKTILNDGTLFASRDAESQDILTAMGYKPAQYFEYDIVIKKIVWTARDGYTLPHVRPIVNAYKPLTTAAFVKLNSGAVDGFYCNGAELGKWKLCGTTFCLGNDGYTTIHPYNNNSTGTGGGEILIAMAGVVDGHVDLTNPTNWRIF